MPPWVARQWHAWGCSRSISGDLCRIQRLGSPVNLRFYAQRSVRDGPNQQFRNVNSAVIVPSSVANTRPEDLIAHIKPILRQRVSKDRFAVFFVTPSFATWLVDDQVFLHKALRRTYAHLLDRTETPYARIHALCAVVDKLPVSRPIRSIETLEEETRQRIHEPTVQEIGQEGIAYATLSPSDSLPTSSGVGHDKAAISFVTFEGSNDDDRRFSDTVRLPLANTVFQTGSPTTMTYSTWEKAKGSQEFMLKDRQNISHHGIRMQVENDIQSTVLSVPLVPLSKPRQVEASMGNILRRVKGPHGASITASQELEQQVPRYFSARGEPSQATTVWALVTGPDQQSMLDSNAETYSSLRDQSEEKQWEHLWKQDPPSWTPLVPIALKYGARLHRVLSGGGGWGKKAGLLSLDPIPTMEDNLAVGPSDFEGTFNGGFGEEGPDLDSALQQVARPGDWVQFFISPSVTAKGDIVTGSHGGKQVWGLELGTIPSTTDAMPVVIPGETGTAARNEVSVFKSTFGGLAEGGMVISRRVKHGQGNDFSTVGVSTVDVPFSRFSVLNWRTESSTEDDVDPFRGCHEPKSSHYDLDLARIFYEDTMPRFLGLDSSIVKSFSKACDTKLHTPRQDKAAAGLLTPRQRPQIQTTVIGERAQSLALNPPFSAQQGSNVANVIPNKSRNIGRLGQTTKVPVPEQPLIHFYQLDSAPKDELAYCTDMLRRVDRKVARYVREYRELINQIRRHNGLRMDLAVRQPKLEEKLLLPTRKVATVTPRGLAPWLGSATNESAHWVGMYQKDFENVMSTIRMNKIHRDGLLDTMLVPVGAPRGGGDNSHDTGIKHLTNVRLTPRRLLAGLSETTRQMQFIIDGLEDRVNLTLHRAIAAVLANKIFGTTTSLAHAISDTLTVVSFRAHIALDVNNSAVTVYALHLHLRWELTGMIMTRRRRNARVRKQGGELRTIAKIALRLGQLRMFSKNLFVGRNHLTPFMRRLLYIRELDHHLSRKKLISDGKYIPRYRSRAGMKKPEIRKMDAQYGAVKALEDLVKGWII